MNSRVYRTDFNKSFTDDSGYYDFNYNYNLVQNRNLTNQIYEEFSSFQRNSSQSSLKRNDYERIPSVESHRYPYYEQEQYRRINIRYQRKIYRHENWAPNYADHQYDPPYSRRKNYSEWNYSKYKLQKFYYQPQHNSCTERVGNSWKTTNKPKCSPLSKKHSTRIPPDNIKSPPTPLLDETNEDDVPDGKISENISVKSKKCDKCPEPSVEANPITLPETVEKTIDIEEALQQLNNSVSFSMLDDLQVIDMDMGSPVASNDVSPEKLMEDLDEAVNFAKQDKPFRHQIFKRRLSYQEPYGTQDKRQKIISDETKIDIVQKCTSLEIKDYKLSNNVDTLKQLTETSSKEPEPYLVEKSNIEYVNKSLTAKSLKQRRKSTTCISEDIFSKECRNLSTHDTLPTALSSDSTQTSLIKKKIVEDKRSSLLHKGPIKKPKFTLETKICANSTKLNKDNSTNLSSWFPNLDKNYTIPKKVAFSNPEKTFSEGIVSKKNLCSQREKRTYNIKNEKTKRPSFSNPDTPFLNSIESLFENPVDDNKLIYNSSVSKNSHSKKGLLDSNKDKNFNLKLKDANTNNDLSKVKSLNKVTQKKNTKINETKLHTPIEENRSKIKFKINKVPGKSLKKSVTMQKPLKNNSDKQNKKEKKDISDISKSKKNKKSISVSENLIKCSPKSNFNKSSINCDNNPKKPLNKPENNETNESSFRKNESIQSSLNEVVGEKLKESLSISKALINIHMNYSNSEKTLNNIESKQLNEPTSENLCKPLANIPLDSEADGSTSKSDRLENNERDILSSRKDLSNKTFSEQPTESLDVNSINTLNCNKTNEKDNSTLRVLLVQYENVRSKEVINKIEIEKASSPNSIDAVSSIKQDEMIENRALLDMVTDKLRSSESNEISENSNQVDEALNTRDIKVPKPEKLITNISRSTQIQTAIKSEIEDPFSEKCIIVPCSLCTARMISVENNFNENKLVIEKRQVFWSELMSFKNEVLVQKKSNIEVSLKTEIIDLTDEVDDMCEIIEICTNKSNEKITLYSSDESQSDKEVQVVSASIDPASIFNKNFASVTKEKTELQDNQSSSNTNSQASDNTGMILIGKKELNPAHNEYSTKNCIEPSRLQPIASEQAFGNMNICKQNQLSVNIPTVQVNNIDSSVSENSEAHSNKERVNIINNCNAMTTNFNDPSVMTSLNKNDESSEKRTGIVDSNPLLNCLLNMSNIPHTNTNIVTASNSSNSKSTTVEWKSTVTSTIPTNLSNSASESLQQTLLNSRPTTVEWRPAIIPNLSNSSVSEMYIPTLFNSAPTTVESRSTTTANITVNTSNSSTSEGPNQRVLNNRPTTVKPTITENTTTRINSQQVPVAKGVWQNSQSEGNLTDGTRVREQAGGTTTLQPPPYPTWHQCVAKYVQLSVLTTYNNKDYMKYLELNKIDKKSLSFELMMIKRIQEFKWKMYGSELSRELSVMNIYGRMASVHSEVNCIWNELKKMGSIQYYQMFLHMNIIMCRVPHFFTNHEYFRTLFAFVKANVMAINNRQQDQIIQTPNSNQEFFTLDQRERLKRQIKFYHLVTAYLKNSFHRNLHNSDHISSQQKMPTYFNSVTNNIINHPSQTVINNVPRENTQNNGYIYNTNQGSVCVTQSSNQLPYASNQTQFVQNEPSMSQHKSILRNIRIQKPANGSKELSGLQDTQQSSGSHSLKDAPTLSVRENILQSYLQQNLSNSIGTNANQTPPNKFTQSANNVPCSVSNVAQSFSNVNYQSNTNYLLQTSNIIPPPISVLQHPDNFRNLSNSIIQPFNNVTQSSNNVSNNLIHSFNNASQSSNKINSSSNNSIQLTQPFSNITQPFNNSTQYSNNSTQHSSNITQHSSNITQPSNNITQLSNNITQPSNNDILSTNITQCSNISSHSLNTSIPSCNNLKDSSINIQNDIIRLSNNVIQPSNDIQFSNNVTEVSNNITQSTSNITQRFNNDIPSTNVTHTFSTSNHSKCKQSSNNINDSQNNIQNDTYKNNFEFKVPVPPQPSRRSSSSSIPGNDSGIGSPGSSTTTSPQKDITSSYVSYEESVTQPETSSVAPELTHVYAPMLMERDYSDEIDQCSPAVNENENNEIIDLTWLEDTDITQIKEEFDIVKKEEVDEDEIILNQEKYPEAEFNELLYDGRKCICDNLAVYLCKCRMVMYCSVNCQRQDWVQHRPICMRTLAKMN